MRPTTSWDPDLYLRFGDARTRAAQDLLARVPLATAARVVDLGCGPGNSTALLRARYPDADIIGLDSSAEMLARAHASGVEARWVQASFDDWSPDAPTDLLFANASLQWASDPVRLVMRLYGTLEDGGALAFQNPHTFGQPSHTDVREVAGDPRWRDALAGVHQYDPGFAKAPDFARALMPLGAEVDAWTTEYLHVLEGPDAVFRWLSGTGLRPYVQALDGSERSAFEEAVRVRLGAAYPPEPDGRTLFPFRRLLVVARKPR